MTEEEIKALKDAKEAAERRAAEAEALAQAKAAEADKSKTDLSNVVAELQEERRKKNEALNKANLQSGEQDIASVVARALEEREQAERKKAVEEALQEFKLAKPEFQADTAGIVFAKFQETLNKFNLSDVSTKEAAKRRFEEVYKFHTSVSNFESGGDSYEGTPQQNSSVPGARENEDKEISKALEIAGVDSQKYKELKQKYPDALSGLGI